MAPLTPAALPTPGWYSNSSLSWQTKELRMSHDERSKTIRKSRAPAAVCLALCVMGLGLPAAPAAERVLHNFQNPPHRTSPYAAVIRDSDGNRSEEHTSELQSLR